MDDTDKTYKNIAALREMRIPVLPPDVNRSRVKFTVADSAIRFGLGAIRGVGVKSAEEIIAVREKGGDFKNLADFCTRVGTQLLNRRVLEALIKCGALDSTGMARAVLMAQVDDALKLAQREESDAERNQISLFNQKIMPSSLTPRGPLNEWPQNELLSFEKEALGFFITAHPLDKYERELRRIGKLTTADLPSASDGSRVRLAGVIHAVKLKNNKAGKRYATFQLEDREGAVECIAWPETYQKYESTIAGELPVVAKGKLDVDDERAQIIVDELRPLGAALTEAVHEVRIRAPRERIANGQLTQIKELLQRHNGQTLIYLHVDFEDGREAVFLLGDRYRVAPTESFVAELEQMLAPNSVELR